MKRHCDKMVSFAFGRNRVIKTASDTDNGRRRNFI